MIFQKVVNLKPICYNKYNIYEYRGIKMVNRSKVACFSGHRRIPQNCEELKANLKKEIICLIERGVVFFGAGGALGFDMLAEEAVLQLKDEYPQIRLILVLPCPPDQQILKWNSNQQKKYYEILQKADKVRILSSQYTNECMLVRNRHLVDNSAYLVCYLREQRGGTAYTVDYAKHHGLRIIQL